MSAIKVLALSVILGLTSGCASFIASNTSNAVGTESGERSLGQIVIDKSIERTAKINLYKLDSRFRQSRINIESFHSHVLLTGQVPDAHLKQLAEDNLKAMSDVKAVHNFLSVGNQISYSTIMQDIAVTANTKGLIMRAPVLRDSKVLVHTEDGVLYVMGRLSNAESADLNDVLQKVGNVSKIVTLIDSIEQNQSTGTAAYTPQTGNTVGVGLGATTIPLNQAVPSENDPTPVAIDPNEQQPVNDQVPAQDMIQSSPVNGAL